ncbi:MAG TPA: cyclic-di-AMP receptor [Candidatus Binatia bacterium]|nr:cyclic-di-AMP receptor [Candidatus Binatia bacterium]
MKLVVAIVHAQDADACVTALNAAGFICTRYASFGGFLDHDNVTLLIGVDALQVDEVIDIARRHAKRRNEIAAAGGPASATSPASSPIEVEVGGATVFVLDVDRFERL